MDPANSKPIIVFWRPGCGFCMMLEGTLQAADLSYQRHNIWEDPEAAAFVRSVANGNETVPTVVVGDQAMVNPSICEVIEAFAGSDQGAG
ncbi:MAG: NrdH-redoxin [Acidimicrobiia bacterium]|nr:NrdH-redoxin [Acidimicrobiia bacterium]